VPHVIRLRGPWEYEVVGNEGASGTVQMPCNVAEIVETEFRGTVRFSRRFNRPTGLDEATRVWLVLEDDFESQVILNGQVLVPPGTQNGPARLNITSLLQPHNLVVLELNLDQNPRPLRIGNVQLGIESHSNE
jgi:hypothetical protein